MAKKMDAFHEELAQLSKLDSRATELRRELREIEVEQKSIRQFLISKMGKAIVGSLGGVPVFEVVPSGRKSVPLDNVYKYAPKDIWDLLIKLPEGKTVKWLKVAIK